MATTAEGEPAPPRERSRQAILLIMVVSLLNAMAAMIIIPVLPRLVQGFTGDTAHAAGYVGEFAGAFALVQFFAAPVLGALSDAYGRRTVILVSALGLSVDYVFMALAPSVGWLFVGRMIAGITSASAPAVNAYIADRIPPDERAGAFGWSGAGFAIGFLIGPSLGGLLGDIDLRLPFWVSAALCLAMAGYGLLVLPESLPRERRTRFSLARAHPGRAFRMLGEHPGVLPLTLVLLAMMLAATCLPTTLVLYTDLRFGWSAATVGLYLTFAGLGHLLVQSLLVRRFVARFGERAAATLGFVSVAVGFLIFASVPKGGLFPLGTPFYALTGLVTPSVQAQLTRRVPPDQQGRLQGTVAAIQSMAGLVGPLLFSQLFAFAAGAGRGHVPIGLHLYCCAALLAGGAMLAWRNIPPRRG